MSEDTQTRGYIINKMIERKSKMSYYQAQAFVYDFIHYLGYEIRYEENIDTVMAMQKALLRAKEHHKYQRKEHPGNSDYWYEKIGSLPIDWSNFETRIREVCRCRRDSELVMATIIKTFFDELKMM